MKKIVIRNVTRKGIRYILCLKVIQYSKVLRIIGFRSTYYLQWNLFPQRSKVVRPKLSMVNRDPLQNFSYNNETFLLQEQNRLTQKELATNWHTWATMWRSLQSSRAFIHEHMHRHTPKAVTLCWRSAPLTWLNTPDYWHSSWPVCVNSPQ